MNRDIKAHTQRFWQGFYAQHAMRGEPSPFARWCFENQLNEKSRVLELGCGNGRDSFALAAHGVPVLALDGCERVILDNMRHLQSSAEKMCRFAVCDLENLDSMSRIFSADFSGSDSINTLYSRFVLHALPEAVEDCIWDACDTLFPGPVRMMHEFRTIRDPLMAQGEVLGPCERMTDHYRRFIDPDRLREKLARRGWREHFFVESTGLACYGEDDPVVARLVLSRG